MAHTCFPRQVWGKRGQKGKPLIGEGSPSSYLNRMQAEGPVALTLCLRGAKESGSQEVELFLRAEELRWTSH